VTYLFTYINDKGVDLYSSAEALAAVSAHNPQAKSAPWAIASGAWGPFLFSGHLADAFATVTAGFTRGVDVDWFAKVGGGHHTIRVASWTK
jgi:hypothetical protein